MLRRPIASVPFLASALLATRTMSTSTSIPKPPRAFPTETYAPRHTSWPYTSADFERLDSSPDDAFYVPTRFVTHIDDHAISTLREYYASYLPRTGRILDLCSSWISHLPPDLEKAAMSGELNVVGLGMNRAELDANEVLRERVVHDLNADPAIPASVTNGEKLDGAMCVVSIDYLTQPVEVLRSLKGSMNEGSTVHLVVSNRCFPTKAMARWLGVREDERLQMVGDYMWFAGYREVEIVTLSEGFLRPEETAATMLERTFGRRVDPLWVVRGRNTGE